MLDIAASRLELGDPPLVRTVRGEGCAVDLDGGHARAHDEHPSGG